MLHELIFKKKLYDITWNDIVSFFETEREESAVLEFKSGMVDGKTILKEICAFANTQGGLLIIGSPIESESSFGRHKVCIGDPLPCSTIKNKDSLMQLIASGLAPVPFGIMIHEITALNGLVFLIEVPQSHFPPHQLLGECRYYVRMERSSFPAPHGVVQALFFKRQAPKLVVELTVREYLGLDRWMITIYNESSFPAERIGLLVEVFGVKSVKDASGDYEKMIVNNGFETIHSGFTNKDMVLPRLVNMNHELIVHSINTEYLVKLTFWCSGTDSQVAFYLFDPVSRTLKVYDLNNNADSLELRALLSSKA